MATTMMRNTAQPTAEPIITESNMEYDKFCCVGDFGRLYYDLCQNDVKLGF